MSINFLRSSWGLRLIRIVFSHLSMVMLFDAQRLYCMSHTICNYFLLATENRRDVSVTLRRSGRRDSLLPILGTLQGPMEQAHLFVLSFAKPTVGRPPPTLRESQFMNLERKQCDRLGGQIAQKIIVRFGDTVIL